MMIDIDRFSGEKRPPAVWGYCGYCGGEIGLGERYYDYIEYAVCDRCAARCAWALFEAYAKRRHAEGAAKEATDE